MIDAITDAIDTLVSRGYTGQRAFDYENIVRAVYEIPCLLKMRSTTNKKSSSYGLKHVLENWRHMKYGSGNNYISNGSFIVAMIVLGYKFKFYDNQMNAFFNYTQNK
jgi:hypothetical protein